MKSHFAKHACVIAWVVLVGSGATVLLVVDAIQRETDSITKLLESSSTDRARGLQNEATGVVNCTCPP